MCPRCIPPAFQRPGVSCFMLMRAWPQDERDKRGWWHLRKVTWLRKIVLGMYSVSDVGFIYVILHLDWKCGKSTSHGGAYKVYAWLVVFISKQCFFSVWSCVFCTQQSPAPSGLIHHGPSPLLCPIRIRAAISVLYLWRDAPCIAFMPTRPNSIK